ncbi:hypothetical protein KC351_g647 [Hortaea werneckii]|nr:hypothetical protein KC351_g647 [Hortaea werneckii]
MTTESSEMLGMEGDMNIPELQRDLQRKYKNVGREIESMWRAFSPKQRETAMRETVGDGKVLRNSRDPGLGGLNGFLSDWNLEDMTSTPNFFLDRLKFRVDNDLHRQLFEGPNGTPGDRQLARTSAMRMRASAPKDKWVAFLDLGKDYGGWLKVNGAEGRRSIESMAALSGLFLPAHEGQPVLWRQMITLGHYNHLMEEILELGSSAQVKKKAPAKAYKDTTNALANLSIDPKPLKASISTVIAQAVEQKLASEDYLELLRGEPVVLHQAVQKTNCSRPELVPDELGRILPLITDIYISRAFFEVISTALQVIVTWDYIVRLVHMLDGLEDKVKRTLLIQELSKVCHLEYRRAQIAFQCEMSLRPGVAGSKFRRITSGGHSRVAIKGKPSDVTTTDPQLHYILRLCHTDTNHKDAVQWIQKLDEHNTQHADDRQRLSETQVFALGDLAIIVSFMHSLSSCLTMASRSTKAGVFFTGRIDRLNEELSQYKAEADFGDHLVPMDSILKPQAASNALKALDDYMVERSGAKMGSLYDGMLDECLEDIEQKYADAKSYLQKDMKTNAPSPTGEKASTSFRARERREKEKTRPATASTHEITPLAPQDPQTPLAPSSHFKVKASTALVFDTLFTKSESRGSVSWTDFVAAMAELGFSVTPKGGSIFTFNPPETMVAGSITLHRPHASDVEGWKLLWIARRLRKKYGWSAETFRVD